MHKATEKNMLDVIDLFLNYGGDPTIKNKAGFTCLHLAARNGYRDIVKLLLSKGTLLNLIFIKVLIRKLEIVTDSVLLTGPSKISISIAWKYCLHL